jgi:hypothetical protein
MIYTYEIEKDGVKETHVKWFFPRITSSMFWEFFDLKKQRPTWTSSWINREKTKAERLLSFKRTKRWLKANHPEMLL